MTPTQTTARPTVILATLAAIAIALAVCATAATVIVASDVTRERERLQAIGGVAAVPFDDAREQMVALGTLRELVDSLVAPLAPFEPLDSATIALMTVQWGSARTQRAVFAPAATAFAPVDTPVVSYDSVAAVLTEYRAGNPVPTDRFATLATDTTSSWLGVWRRFARGRALPAMWGYRDGLPGVSSAFDLPTRNYMGVRRLQALNEALGWLALSRGDHAAALARGLENVAASRHYLDSPLMIDFVMGRGLAGTGARLVAAAARAQGRSQLVALATAIDQTNAGASVLSTTLRRAAEQDAASPQGTLAFELFDEEKLPFAVRVEILYAAIAGACNHTREVLFGFSAEREARLRTVAEAHRADPVMGSVLQLIPPAARRVREAPTSLLSSNVWPTAGTLDVLLPDAVAARAVLCQQSF